MVSMDRILYGIWLVWIEFYMVYGEYGLNFIWYMVSMDCILYGMW